LPAADAELRELLDALPAPSRPPGFFDELHEAMHEQDRARVRRWRVSSTVLAAIAVPAVATAVALAATWGGGSTVDRALSCSVRSNVAITTNATAGNIPGQVLLAEFAKVPSPDAVLLGGSFRALFVAGTVSSGYTLDGTVCRPASTRVPLAASGLPAAGVFKRGYYTSLAGVCAFKGRALVRVRVRLDAKGDAARAQLAVWRQAGPKPQPLAYIDWSPSLVRTYLSGRCRS
jgi:hypothetical protein